MTYQKKSLERSGVSCFHCGQPLYFDSVKGEFVLCDCDKTSEETRWDF